MKKETVPVRNSLLLLLTATIWGIAFVAQSVSMDYIGGFTFNSIRSLIGSLTLLPVILLLSKPKSAEEKNRPQTSSNQKILITGGICCGIILCLASNFQQFGIKYTTVGKAGFITACYIIIVPVIGIFLRKKCSPFIWIAVILSLCGLYLLCLTPGEGFAIGKGELLVLVCAFLFSIHILVIDHFSPLVDGVKMSCIQFFVCGILSGTRHYFLKSRSYRYPCRQSSSSLCRYHVLWCRLYPADHWAEKYEPYCSIFDPQPGILHLCHRRMADSRTEFK